MSQRVFLRQLVRHTPRVAFSRIRRGPGRPSWSFGFELFTSALRDTSREFAALGWPEQRAAYDAVAQQRSAIFQRVRREETSVFGVPATWFTPLSAAEPAITLLYFHGGGYVFGSARSHADLVTRIALGCPARTLLPEYRLAPEHPFPSAIDDAVRVYHALLAGQGAASGPVDPKRLVIGGDSAGGGLAMALLLRLREQKAPLPAGAVLLSPWVDLTARGGSVTENARYDWGTEEVGGKWIRAYVGDHDPRDPLVSPVFADLSGLPPLLIQVGTAELLRDQASTLARRATERGVDARLTLEPDMVHAWQSFAWLFPRCVPSIDEIGAFAREVTRT